MIGMFVQRQLGAGRDVISRNDELESTSGKPDRLANVIGKGVEDLLDDNGLRGGDRFFRVGVVKRQATAND